MLWREIHSTDLLWGSYCKFWIVLDFASVSKILGFQEGTNRELCHNFWVEIFSRGLCHCCVWAALISIREVTQFTNYFNLLNEGRLQRKLVSQFPILLYFWSFSLSEIANNRCLNSSQVKNSNWFQKKLDWILASVWHLWKYKHMQGLHFQLHSKIILKKNPMAKFWNYLFRRKKILKIYKVSDRKFKILLNSFECQVYLTTWA